MHTTTLGPESTDVILDLHDAVERLADAMADEPPIAAAIRRFGRALPRHAASTTPACDTPPRPRRARPVRDVLYRALDEGALDARRFDYLMLAERRAARARARRAAIAG